MTEQQPLALHLIDACQEIGGIAEANVSYMAGIARRIAKTGKSLEELTVAELLAIHRDYNAFYNELYS